MSGYDRLDRVLSVVLTVAAVAVAGVVVHRALAPPFQQQGLDRMSSPRPTTYVDEWKQVIHDGILIGRRNAPVQIIEFMDLQCPFCARFHDELMPILSDHPDDVAVTFVHLPLQMHAFAQQAALAAECAHQQGRFIDFVNVVLEDQDSFGQREWWDYGRVAGIPDSTAFDQCLSARTNRRIDAGKAWASRLGFTGTPTVLVNGWRLGAPPNTEQLRTMIGRIKKGDSPVDVEA